MIRLFFWTAWLAACESPPYLALGDSYTIGQSVAVGERWPEQLATTLQLEGVHVDRPRIIARTGWTVAELDGAINAAGPASDNQLVTLLIGVNDQFRGGRTEDYRPAFRAMLQRAIGFAGGHPCRVVVLSIPDYGNTPFGERNAERIGREIDAFNAVNRTETEAAGARYVDITGLSRQPRAELVADDGLHPSGVAYGEWVQAALPAARQAVGCFTPP